METAVELMFWFCGILGINLLIIFYPLLFLPFINIKKSISIKQETIKAYMSDGRMEREINLKYSPAFISLLLDRKIEPAKDLLADVLNLINKKVIKVKWEDNDEPKLLVDNLKLKETKVSKDELYIIKHIEKINIGYNPVFDFEKFEESVKEEFVELEFDIKNKLKKYLKGLPKALMYGVRNLAVIMLIFTLPLALMFCSIVILNFVPETNWFTSILFYIVFFFGYIPLSLVIILYMFKWIFKRITNIIKPPIILSEKGKEEYKKILKFKYYLEQYTLIKDKEIESMVLWGAYIPYAIAIGVNEGYKKDIENICKELNIEKLMLKVFKFELKRNYII